MSKLRCALVIAAALALLAVPVTAVSPPFPWTTSALKTLPTAAVGVSVTPSGTAFANSAWVEVSSSTSTAWILTGVVVNPAASPLYTQFDVGVGGAGSEAVIATGQVVGRTLMNGRFAFTIPIDAIPLHSRVSIRMRKAGTSTTPWTFALTYYEKPLIGYLVTTPTPLTASSYINFACGTSGTYGSWQEVDPAIADTWTVTGAVIESTSTAIHVIDLQIGTGASSSEVVKTTLRHPAATFNEMGNSVNELHPAYGPIAGGTRVAIRCRVDDGAAETIWAGLLLHQGITGTGIDEVRTTSAQQFYPAAGGHVALAGVTNPWDNTAYTELDASTPTPISITQIQGNGGIPAEYACDISTGGAGSETPAATALVFFNGLIPPNSVNEVPISPSRLIASGSRVSLRCRSGNTGRTTGSNWAVGYLVSPGNTPTISVSQKEYPVNGTASVTPNASAWALSGYTTIVSSTATDVLITQLIVDGGQTSTDTAYEAVLATGSSGAEVPFTTIRGRWGRDQDWLRLPAAHLISSGKRISVAMRKAGTTTSAWLFGVTYLEDSGLTSPANTPAVFLSVWNRDRWARAFSALW